MPLDMFCHVALPPRPAPDTYAAQVYDSAAARLDDWHASMAAHRALRLRADKLARTSRVLHLRLAARARRDVAYYLARMRRCADYAPAPRSA
jgi:hypothetical protein